VARFVAPQHSTKLLPERRLEKRERARAERQQAEMLTSRLAKPGGVLKGAKRRAD
jgi:predicted amino acid dehydrogenase